MSFVLTLPLFMVFVYVCICMCVIENDWLVSTCTNLLWYRSVRMSPPLPLSLSLSLLTLSRESQPTVLVKLRAN